MYTKESIKPQIEKGEVVYCTEPYCQGKEEALVRFATARCTSRAHVDPLTLTGQAQDRLLR